eukprot:scaffold2322_cov135-Cylindrotheca_fusiformis.AAC.8
MEDGDDDKKRSRPDTQPDRNKNNRRKGKKPRKEVAKSNTRRGFDFDANVDERDRAPHAGSFANPNLREQYGVSLEPRIDYGEDQKTLKRKVAFLLGFLGTNYGGFQVNADQRTIQAEVERALYRAGMLTTMNFGLPHKYSWSSSARTDKGVHACAQVCSCKVELLESDLKEDNSNDLEIFRERLESYLPPDIRVMDLLRTTRNMCAKTQRDRVRYQYMVPSFMLYPDWKQLLEDQEIPLEGRKEMAKAPLSAEEVKKIKDQVEGYRSTKEQRALLQSALARYEGTNPFHNFTKGLKPGQPQANRFIEYFRVQDPVVFEGVEWIPTQVLGQSFLLNQIRKMISMAIDIARGATPLDTLEKALARNETVRIGIAPAQGLFLEMSYFGGYNRRKAQNQDLPDLDWSQEGPAKERWAAFRDTIRQHIVEEEKEQGNFIQYMYIQECIFDYRTFYNLEGNGAEDEKEKAVTNDMAETSAAEKVPE